MVPVDFIDLINRMIEKNGQDCLNNLLISGLVGDNEWACVSNVAPHRTTGYMLGGNAFNFATCHDSLARPKVSKLFVTNIYGIPESQHSFVRSAFYEDGSFCPTLRHLAIEVYFPAVTVQDDDNEGLDEEVEELPDPEWFDRMEEGLSEDSI